MNYECFIEKVKRGVEEITKRKLDDGVVVVREVLKNNNVSLQAISIVRDEEEATPTIYLEKYYADFKKGRTVNNICHEIFETYLHSVDNFKLDIDIKDISVFDKVKHSIYYKVINYEMNKTLLMNVPHYRFLDLAIVFYILVLKDDEGQATALIDNQHLVGWEITKEELRDIAFENTWKRFPVVVQKMEDIVSEMVLDDILGDEDWVPDDEDGYDDERISEDTQYGDYTYGELKEVVREEIEDLKSDDLNMYVMSNTMKHNGATCITYPNAIRNFAEEHQCDVFIIPSSIHELILIADTRCSIESLNELIQDVNRRQLDPMEVLSDHAYVYHLETGEII